jgi:hypothetical protein
MGGSFHGYVTNNQMVKKIFDLRCEQENQGIKKKNHQMNQVLLSNEISKEHLPALSLVVNTPCLCAVDLIHHPTQT